MTATARVAATQSPDSAYTVSVASGSTATFYCYGLKGSERVQFTSPDSGGVYRLGRTLNGEGKMEESVLTPSRNQIRFTGPIDIKIEKPATTESVEVGEYT